MTRRTDTRISELNAGTLKEGTEITMGKILEFRHLEEGQNTNYFFTYFEHLGGYGNNRNDYTRSIKHRLLSECLSVPSETYLLLMIENFLTRAAYDVLYGGTSKTRRNISQKDKMTPKPEYTNSGGGAPSKDWHSGWSPEGTKRYNKLSKMVIASRSHDRAKEWEERFRAYTAAENGKINKKRKAPPLPKVKELPYNTVPQDW
jgi:hypothetical protein